jgi:hypothetical protein
MVMRAEFSLESCCSIPSMIVWDFGAEMVGHMGLGDPMEEEAVDVSVDGTESSSLEVKRSVSVVWKHWVVMLEEGDHHEPVLKTNKRIKAK